MATRLYLHSPPTVLEEQRCVVVDQGGLSISSDRAKLFKVANELVESGENQTQCHHGNISPKVTQTGSRLPLFWAGLRVAVRSLSMGKLRSPIHCRDTCWSVGQLGTDSTRWRKLQTVPTLVILVKPKLGRDEGS